MTLPSHTVLPEEFPSSGPAPASVDGRHKHSLPALCCDFTRLVAHSMHTIRHPVTLASIDNMHTSNMSQGAALSNRHIRFEVVYTIGDILLTPIWCLQNTMYVCDVYIYDIICNIGMRCLYVGIYMYTKVSSYLAQYPVCRTDQSTLHCTPWWQTCLLNWSYVEWMKLLESPMF